MPGLTSTATPGGGNVNRKETLVKKTINILRDAIAWMIILLGGAATIIWLMATMIFAGITMTEFVILVVILAFLIWRIARWW